MQVISWIRRLYSKAQRGASESYSSKSRLAVDREFMYIGSAGPGPGGRAEGRADGRAGLILNDSATMFIVFHKNHCVFLSVRIGRQRKYRFLLQK